MITTQKFVRKPLFVDAVQVTGENIVELSAWCQGEIKNYYDKPLMGEEAANHAVERYIHVRVHNPKNTRQTKAFVGDWLLYTDRGYKVYTQKAFKNSFDPCVPNPTAHIGLPPHEKTVAEDAVDVNKDAEIPEDG